MSEQKIEAPGKSRDAIRRAIVNNAKPKSKMLEFFGEQVEVRQPPMKAVMEAREEENRAVGVASMIVRYTYVPGTDDRLFLDEDINMLMGLPFGADMARLSNAMSEMTDIDIEGELGNSD